VTVPSPAENATGRRAPAAFITGGASGIGAAAARLFAADGYSVVAADLDGDRARAVAQEITEAGRVAIGIAVDVREETSVRDAVRVATARFGELDVVLPNAGLVRPEVPLERVTDADVDAMLDVNVKGVVRTLRATIPHIRNGGSIVVTSSTSGIIAHPGAAVYAATKIALIGLARSLAAELAPRRIRVNAVCPGGVDTPFLNAAYGDAASDQISEYEARNPLGRIGQPDDVARAMLYLAGAHHVTGVALRVDGGDGLAGAI